ncbi:MAG TPA: hypothetical protein DCF62_12650 [Porticoccaceae bacterium]|nr:hypothetical protein [Porticoccaceae bacterium]
MTGAEPNLDLNVLNDEKLRELLVERVDSQTHGVVVLDQNGHVLVWNTWMGDWTGITGAEALGRSLEAMIPAIVGGEFARGIDEALRSQEALTWTLDREPRRLDQLEAAMTRGDRLLPLSRFALTPMSWRDGRGCLLEFMEAPYTSTPVASSTSIRNDRLEMPKHDDNLSGEDEGFVVQLESSEHPLIEVSASGLIGGVNEHLLEVSGFSREQLIGTPLRLLFPALSDAAESDDYRALVATRLKQAPESQMEIVDADGRAHTYQITVCPSLRGGGYFVLWCRDISSQTGNLEALKRQRELLAAVFSQVTDGIVLTDAEGAVEQINPVGLEMLGLGSEQGYGAAIQSLLQMQDERGAHIDPCGEALRRGTTCVTPDNTQLLVKQRAPIAISGSAMPLRDRQNRITGCVLVFRTIDPATRMSSRLSWQTDHDPLTQLPNRRFLEARLAQAIESARLGDQRHALLYIDLHSFSLVNDTGGRVAGDMLLLECGKLLQEVVGVDHLVARVGNDEFAVLLQECSVDEVNELIETMLQQVRSFSFPWEERRLKIGVNVGVEIIDSSTSSETDVLVAAAASCAAAKEVGRNRVHFRQEQEDRPVLRKAATWVPKISDAIEQDRFQLYYQPIIALGGDRKQYSHFEVLIRLQDEGGQLVAPGEFIPAAEQYGLIDDIDRWVVKRVIADLGGKALRNQSDLRLSVNLSGATIGDERFKNYLLQLIDDSNIDPRQLQFEITETTAIREFDRALDLIHQVKARGCYFSLDDFGSGLSSFGYLKDLPVDFLKFDGSFIRNIEFNDVDYSMVSAINHLAHIMGISTIAESIENQSQLAILEQIGVDYGQGFYIDIPQTLDKFFP